MNRYVIRREGPKAVLDELVLDHDLTDAYGVEVYHAVRVRARKQQYTPEQLERRREKQRLAKRARLMPLMIERYGAEIANGQDLRGKCRGKRIKDDETASVDMR